MYQLERRSRLKAIVPIPLLAVGVGCIGALLTQNFLVVPIVCAIAIFFLFWQHDAVKFGITFAISGPLLFSTLKFGGITADNAISVAGSALLVATMVGQRSKKILTPLSLYLFSIVSIVGFSIAMNLSVSKKESFVRYTSLLILSVFLSSGGVKHIRFAYRCLMTVISIGAVSVLLQPLLGWPAPFLSKEGEVGAARYGGLFGHPNFAAYPLLLGALTLILSRYFSKKATYIATLLLVAAAMITGSRTAILVFFVLLAWIAFKRGAVLARWIIVLAIVAVPFASVSMSRFLNLLDSGGVDGDNAGGWRVGQWEYALELGRSEPFTGIGWGHAQDLLRSNLGVHSSYIEVLVEAGIVGAAIFVAALVNLLLKSMNIPGAAILVVYVMLTGISDRVLLYPSVLVVLIVGWSVLWSMNTHPDIFASPHRGSWINGKSQHKGLTGTIWSIAHTGSKPFEVGYA